MHEEGIALRTSHLAGRRRFPAAVSITVLAVSLTGACSDTSSPGTAPPPPPSASAPATTPPPPVPASSAAAAPPNTSAPATKPSQAPPPSVPGTCGTVTSASGATLQILGGAGGGVDCATGTRIVGEFHKKIAGKQAPDSNVPVSDSVEGWLCVSGPPAAQGGTTCGKDDLSIYAAVVPSE
jgi:hypothetical protein